MARIGTSSTGGNVNIQDTNGNPIVADNGALSVNLANGFSDLTPGSPNQVDVTANNTLLFAANPNRKYAHIVNNSGNTIFIQYSASAVLGQGIKIPPNTLYTIESTNLWLGIVNAIGVMSSQLIDILEGE